jgi:hypothetical protein
MRHNNFLHCAVVLALGLSPWPLHAGENIDPVAAGKAAAGMVGMTYSIDRRTGAFKGEGLLVLDADSEHSVLRYRLGPVSGTINESVATLYRPLLFMEEVRRQKLGSPDLWAPHFKTLTSLFQKRWSDPHKLTDGPVAQEKFASDCEQVIGKAMVAYADSIGLHSVKNELLLGREHGHAQAGRDHYDVYFTTSPPGGHIRYISLFGLELLKPLRLEEDVNAWMELTGDHATLVGTYYFSARWDEGALEYRSATTRIDKDQTLMFTPNRRVAK